MTSIRLKPIVVTAFIIAGAARFAGAHGTPIQVGASGGALSVFGGAADDGYAPRLFFEDDEDGNGTPAPGPVLNLGNLFLWEIPGFHINGLNTASSLSVEVLAPAVAETPTERRTVWYWNATDGVVPSATELHLLGIGPRAQTISPSDTDSLPPFLLIDEVGGTAAQGGQQGFHNHDLLSYALDTDAPPAFGAYGFFARLTSNLYAPSNPFLVVLNYGVEYEEMSEAAVAINAAAATVPDVLPGDFNEDGAVDAADYAVWRKSVQTSTEYGTWTQHFGILQQNSAAGGSARHAPVPEPNSLALLFAALLGAVGAGRLRKS